MVQDRDQVKNLVPTSDDTCMSSVRMIQSLNGLIYYVKEDTSTLVGTIIELKVSFDRELNVWTYTQREVYSTSSS